MLCLNMQLQKQIQSLRCEISSQVVQAVLEAVDAEGHSYFDENSKPNPNAVLAATTGSWHQKTCANRVVDWTVICPRRSWAACRPA